MSDSEDFNPYTPENINQALHKPLVGLPASEAIDIILTLRLLLSQIVGPSENVLELMADNSKLRKVNEYIVTLFPDPNSSLLPATDHFDGDLDTMDTLR